MSSRTYQHIIDTKAVKKVINALPDHWVVRELTERDYGIDLLVEIFEMSGTDGNKNDRYHSTGNVLYLQIKGTDEELKIDSDENITMRLKQNNILYFEKFAVPILLVRVSTTNKSSDIYFLWIQKYIKSRLNIEVPDWKDRPKTKKGNFPDFKFEIPVENSLQKNLYKLSVIASKNKYMEELVEFMDLYHSIDEILDALAEGYYEQNHDALVKVKELALSLQSLKTLYRLNPVDLSEGNATTLFAHVNSYREDDNMSDIYEFKNKEKFEELFHTGATSIRILEEVAEDVLNEKAF